MTGQTLMNLNDTVLNSINAISSVNADYTQNKAKLATQNKQIKLEEDVINLMDTLRRNGDSTKWQTDANTFFQSVKSGMSDKNSPYYCENNLQAEMFTSILENSRLGVNQRLGQMVYTADRDKALVNYKDSLQRLKKLCAGQQFIDQANELARGLKDSGFIDDQQYASLLDSHYETAYTTLIVDTFDKSIDSAIKNGEDADALFQKVRKNADDLMGSDINGLPKSFDREVFDKTALAQCKAFYNARLSDIQQGNANKLAGIFQTLSQQQTAEGRQNIALQGQRAMNSMPGLQLSENDRLAYAARFDLSNANVSKGNGSSLKKSDFDSFDKLMESRGDLAVQVWLEGLNGNMYDVTSRLSDEYVKQWFSKPWQENYNKSEAESKTTFDFRYAGKVSQESLVDAVLDKVLDKYPEIKSVLGKDFANLRKDMQKNPKEYGTDNVEAMAHWLLDAVYSADPNVTTSKQILEQWQQFKNDCYLEPVKYVQLKDITDKNSLVKKFDARKPDQIAQAARISMEKDYVYTDIYGNEQWAEGRKEALEAPGGIINVLENGLAGTLDIPKEDIEAGKIGYKYVQTEDDMTSQPIFTYGGHEYEVLPNDDNKGFRVHDITDDVYYDGQIGGKSKERRAEEKKAAKETVQTTHSATRKIEDERAEERITAIQESKEMPPAMKGTGKIKAELWETGSDVQKQAYLEDTEYAIRQEAKKIEAAKKKKDNKKNAELQDEFYEKYKIRYYDWSNASGKEERMKLILNS